MAIISRPSPNFNDRPAGKKPDMILLHYTGMPTAADALQRLCDPAAKVSSHYVIDEDGAIYQLVDESRRAWHAGVGYWAGETDINGISIGIEIVNPGHEFGYRPFPPAQMESVARLCADIMKRHAIVQRRILGHSDIAPMRKTDPGELFDWRFLADRGIGLMPQKSITPSPITPNDAQKLLSQIGYQIDATGILDNQTNAVIAAFQRHFCPDQLDAGLTPVTGGAILDVFSRYTQSV